MIKPVVFYGVYSICKIKKWKRVLQMFDLINNEI
jgi:hypothetical protein